MVLIDIIIYLSWMLHFNMISVSHFSLSDRLVLAIHWTSDVELERISGPANTMFSASNIFLRGGLCRALVRLSTRPGNKDSCNYCTNNEFLHLNVLSQLLQGIETPSKCFASMCFLRSLAWGLSFPHTLHLDLHIGHKHGLLVINLYIWTCTTPCHWYLLSLSFP